MSAYLRKCDARRIYATRRELLAFEKYADETYETKNNASATFATKEQLQNESSARVSSDSALSSRMDSISTDLSTVLAEADQALARAVTAGTDATNALGVANQVLNTAFVDASISGDGKSITFTTGGSQPRTKSIDTSRFVVDGMVQSVEIVGRNLVITFNTDAGSRVINIPLSDIFNPSDYYTKSQINSIISSLVSDYYTKQQLQQMYYTKDQIDYKLLDYVYSDSGATDGKVFVGYGDSSVSVTSGNPQYAGLNTNARRANYLVRYSSAENKITWGSNTTGGDSGMTIQEMTSLGYIPLVLDKSYIGKTVHFKLPDGQSSCSFALAVDGVHGLQPLTIDTGSWRLYDSGWAPTSTVDELTYTISPNSFSGNQSGRTYDYEYIRFAFQFSPRPNPNADNFTSDDLVRMAGVTVFITGEQQQYIYNGESVDFNNHTAGNVYSFEKYANLQYAGVINNTYPQGCAVYGDYLFSAYHPGTVFTIYNLATKQHVQTINVSSITGCHCNNIFFGPEVVPGSDFPALYVSDQRSTPKVYVFEVLNSGGVYSLNLIQTLTLPTSNNLYYQDAKGIQYISGNSGAKAMWVGGYTENTFYKEQSVNNLIVYYKIPIPEITEGNQTISYSSVISSFQVAMEDSMQGAFIYNNKIYQSVGVGTDTRPSKICVYDLSQTAKVTDVNITDTGAMNEYEVEGIWPYNGYLMMALTIASTTTWEAWKLYF